MNQQQRHAHARGHADCGARHVFNPRTGRCVTKNGATAKQLGLTSRTGTCPPGSAFSVGTRRCHVDTLRSEISRLRHENEYLKRQLDELYRKYVSVVIS